MATFYAIFFFVVQGTPVAIIPPPDQNHWYTHEKCSEYAIKEAEPFIEYIQKKNLTESGVFFVCLENDFSKKDL
jgi:hypothetical protein